MSLDICITGLGLIGGSLARGLRNNGFTGKIIGVEIDPHHRTIAMYRGLADEFMPLEEAVKQSDIIILCAPVNINRQLLPSVLDMIAGTSKVVTDMGSTKSLIAAAVKDHTARGRYVAAHPMAGTEHSGPAAALDDLFQNKVAIICDREKSDDDALDLITALLQSLKMNIQYMNSTDHDVHVAYVSHISHITSFALALCVLDKEKNASNILSLAAGGFDSTVRLAKSNADTWAPIFIGNSGPLLEVIDTYIEKMSLFKQHILNGDNESLRGLMKEANVIETILNNNTRTNKK